MKYLVMECHPGYAVVLDDEGRFWKVANMGYEVGETVDDVIKACADADAGRHAHRKNPLAGLLVSAACFCTDIRYYMIQYFILTIFKCQYHYFPKSITSICFSLKTLNL